MWVPSGDRLDTKSRVAGQLLEQAFRLAPGRLVLRQEVVDERQRHRSIRPGTGQAAAEHAAHVEQILRERPRPCQDGPGGGIEAFVQRHVHGIEQRGVLGGRDAGVGGGHEQAGAVEVQPDALLAGEGGDAPHVVVAEHGVVHAPHRRLDANDADVRPPTRPERLRRTASCTSASVKPTRPGARGIRLRPLSCWAQSPESL